MPRTNFRQKNDKPQDKPLIFSVKPRLLTLLGDQLIRDANLAVFELVKNAYDADSTKCLVVVENPDKPTEARIAECLDGYCY